MHAINHWQNIYRRQNNLKKTRHTRKENQMGFSWLRASYRTQIIKQISFRQWEQLMNEPLQLGSGGKHTFIISICRGAWPHNYLKVKLLLQVLQFPSFRAQTDIMNLSLRVFILLALATACMGAVKRDGNNIHLKNPVKVLYG